MNTLLTNANQVALNFAHLKVSFIPNSLTELGFEFKDTCWENSNCPYHHLET